MSIIKVVGKCCNLLCSKQGSGRCQHYSGDAGGTCKCCQCLESEHELMGFLTPDNVFHATPSASQAANAAPVAPVLKVGATLPVFVTKQQSQTERMAIFNKSLSPLKKTTEPLKNGATSSKDTSTASKAPQSGNTSSKAARGTPITGGNKKSAAVAATIDLVESEAHSSVDRGTKRPFDACVPVRTGVSTESAEPPRRKLRDNEANRLRDRAEVMLWAPSMSTGGTDLDLPDFHKVNGVLWVPEVLKDHETVDDLTRYCFACYTQNCKADRSHCDAIGCKRYMFIECGRYVDPNEDYYNDDDVETFPEFRCCTCSSMSREEMKREFDDYVDSLPPRRTSVLESSDTWQVQLVQRVPVHHSRSLPPRHRRHRYLQGLGRDEYSHVLIEVVICTARCLICADSMQV